MLGGGWRRLGAAGDKGGRAAEEEAAEYFFTETRSLIFFGGVAGERLKPQRSPSRKKMVTCFPPLQPA